MTSKRQRTGINMGNFQSSKPKDEFIPRSATCLTSAKCFVILISVLIFSFICLMYSISDELKIIARKAPCSSYKIDTYCNYTRVSSIDQLHVNESVNKLIAEHSNSIKGIEENPEFQGMPDPCTKPRRDSGVEDILCMQQPQFLPNYKNPCWMDGDQLRCLPYFQLIGTGKSGTSDLFKRIHFHPEIVPNKGIFGKEVMYWSTFRFRIRNRNNNLKRSGMTVQEFAGRFYADKIHESVTANGYHPLVTGHGDPKDFYYRFKDKAIPQNIQGAEELLWTTPYLIRHIIPNVKLLLAFRDPIERLYSLFHFHSNGKETANSFHSHVQYSIVLWEECLQQHTVRSCVYNVTMLQKMKARIYTSFYAVHMKEWLKVFPLKQFFIYRNEDYAKDMKGTLKSLFHFLDVASPNDTLLDSMVNMPHFYETKKKVNAGPMLESTRQILIDLYKPQMEELAELLNDEKYAYRDTSFGSRAQL